MEMQNYDYSCNPSFCPTYPCSLFGAILLFFSLFQFSFVIRIHLVTITYNMLPINNHNNNGMIEQKNR